MKENLKEIAEFFKVLGDQTRLKIISMLITHKGDLCVGAMANNLGISQPAVSQHLKVLKGMQLVEDNRMGYNIHYRIRMDAFEKYKTFFDEILKHSDNSALKACEEYPNREECGKE